MSHYDSSSPFEDWALAKQNKTRRDEDESKDESEDENEDETKARRNSKFFFLASRRVSS